MRVYRRYRCDQGHEWTVVRKEEQPEIADDTRCPQGHEAVTCNEESPSEEVQILLRPAARIVDKVTGRVWQSGRYFVALLDRADRELCVSSAHYSWDDAIRLAALFKGKDESRALEWWRRKEP